MIAAQLAAGEHTYKMLQVGSVSGVIQTARSALIWDGPRAKRIEIVVEILTEIGLKTIKLSPSTDVQIHDSLPIAA